MVTPVASARLSWKMTESPVRVQTPNRLSRNS